MKKVFLSLLITVLLLLAFTGAAFAANADEIIEVPDIKIIMDSKLTKYTDVPISIKSNTLLPLRELLVNLGVPDDDEHIKYNSEDKSVTIIKDQTSIYLAAGDTVAYVNGQPVKMNVAPVIYNKNGRTYIPLRFVAEALDMKVVWDGSVKTILICDNEKFNSIKLILDKSDEAMKLAEKCKQTIDMDCTVASGQISMQIDINGEAQIDNVQKKMYMKIALNMLGIQMKSDTYYSDNTSYMLAPLNKNWQKKTYLQPEYDKLFASQSNTAMLKVNEPLCAGLSQVPGNNPDEILLKGDVFLNELFRKAMMEQEATGSMLPEAEMNFETFYIEISLNSNTYLVNSILMKVGSVQTSDEETVTIDASVIVLYSDYNSDFQIIIPEDVITNAVEINSVSRLVECYINGLQASLSWLWRIRLYYC